MLEILIGDKDKIHNERVRKICFEYLFSESADTKIRSIESAREIEKQIESVDFSLILMLGNSILKNGIRFPAEKKEKDYIILMAETLNELMEVVTPSMRPSGILIKPVRREKLIQLLTEIQDDYKKQESVQKKFFVKIKNREYAVPEDSILFFESRNKKIVLRTQNQEMEFYGTLEHLKNELGDSFVRTHKSFLVNMKQVKMIHFTNMTIHFPGETYALLSRSYKASVMKEWENYQKKRSEKT